MSFIIKCGSCGDMNPIDETIFSSIKIEFGHSFVFDGEVLVSRLVVFCTNCGYREEHEFLER